MQASLGNTSVSGPGQKARASGATAALVTATVGRSRAAARWTMSGSVVGRPFAVKMAAQATGSRASAAKP